MYRNYDNIIIIHIYVACIISTWLEFVFVQRRI